MKKYLFGLLAVAFAIGAVAFTKAPISKEDQTSYYFKFMGIRNSEESNVEKWDNITVLQYPGVTCDFAHLGCKLTTTSVQTINGSLRPSAVPLASGTNDPIAGSNGVTHVANFQN